MIFLVKGLTDREYGKGYLARDEREESVEELTPEQVDHLPLVAHEAVVRCHQDGEYQP